MSYHVWSEKSDGMVGFWDWFTHCHGNDTMVNGMWNTAQLLTSVEKILLMRNTLEGVMILKDGVKEAVLRVTTKLAGYC